MPAALISSKTYTIALKQSDGGYLIYGRESRTRTEWEEKYPKSLIKTPPLPCSSNSCIIDLKNNLNPIFLLRKFSGAKINCAQYSYILTAGKRIWPKDICTSGETQNIIDYRDFLKMGGVGVYISQDRNNQVNIRLAPFANMNRPWR